MPDRPSLVTDEWHLDAEPGDYIVGLAIEDPVSGRGACGRSRITVPEYAGFCMSDMQIASAVSSGERFARMGGAVVPHPAHAFSREDDLIVYFERYGLSEDTPGRSRFTVTTEISRTNDMPSGRSSRLGGQRHASSRTADQTFFDTDLP